MSTERSFGTLARRSWLRLAILAGCVYGGCASEPKPRPAALDPSNPGAPESPPLALAPLASPPPARRAQPPASTAPADAEHGHEHGGGATGDKTPDIHQMYTCPMHPEVTSDKPGRCPKCGMNLVPKEPAEGKK
jgi:hypothetical protein